MIEITFESVAPLLAFRDLAAALAHYRDVLGFEHRYVNHRPPEPPVYAVVRRGGTDVHMMPERDGVIAGHGGAHFRVRGVAALHDELVSRGVAVEKKDFTSGEHGLRTFTVRDLDGHRLSFAERTSDGA